MRVILLVEPAQVADHDFMWIFHVSIYSKSLLKILYDVQDKCIASFLSCNTNLAIFNILFSGGRICMDMLKMPPKGTWVPTITLETLLVSLQTLLANPNPDDPLMMDIAHEYKYDIKKFKENARKLTEKYAMQR